MKKVYYLSTCDTCKRIMKDVQIDDEFELQDIKFHPLTNEQIDFLYNATGSYEALINKRARKLKEVLTSKSIQKDEDYRELLTMDYTFLKRPVFIVGSDVFAGNAKSTVEEIRLKLKG